MQLEQIVQSQREYFLTNETKSVEFRKNMLRQLAAAIEEFKPQIYQALKQDLNKSEYETYLTEVSLVQGEIQTALKHLNKWSRPVRKKAALTVMPNQSFTMFEPYGVVLVLSPWNYPFQLAMSPLVGAVAAGNCVILKASRSSEHTTKVIGEMLRTNFDSHYIYMVDNELAYDKILAEKYDYIFFTGSARVGRVVMRAASEHLTPVSLELGGKSPCIVERSADIRDAAKKIVWGKTLNAGQTCVAPDFVLAEESIKDVLIREIQHEIHKTWEDAVHSEDYPKIINLHHYMRLCGLVDREGNTIGGERDEKTLKLAPTIFPEANFDSEIMKEEIFGPLIPVIGYKDINTVLDELKKRPKPLACYIFTKNRKFAKKLLSEFSFGGGCINDCIMHLANENLPFGGVGNSGMGHYHGYYSFQTFSHEKAILKNTGILDIPHRFRPYTKEKLETLRKLLGE